jgi:hypothetical protein
MLTLKEKEREYEGTLIGPSKKLATVSSKIALHSQSFKDKSKPSAT